MGQILNDMHTMERNMKKKKTNDNGKPIKGFSLRLCPHKIYILEYKMDCRRFKTRIQVRRDSSWRPPEFILLGHQSEKA